MREDGHAPIAIAVRCEERPEMGDVEVERFGARFEIGPACTSCGDRRHH
jgi:hypothetical protein